MTPIVTAVALSASHTFTKPVTASIRLLAGLGVEGDAAPGRHRQAPVWQDLRMS
ncbi:MAG: hypothetical protein ACN6O5_05295 [Achromobacter sp.]|uniref:hypothetical protein n=1 Tax=unclassified Achromobacter TaxID=2626865 RepID=UPI000AD9F904|nr:hypothetical protein [Achromobacter sp. Root565]